MKPNYKFLSLVYDLLDVVYFNRNDKSPRTAMLNAVPETTVQILDVCAGTCSNSILIAEKRKNATITALDLSADMLKIAEKKFKQKGLQNIKKVVANASKTGLPDSSFDIILLSLVLHEISEDLRVAMLDEAKRLLSQTGQIIVIEWEQPTNIIQKILFFPIKQLEPKGFKEFLRRDLSVYFMEKEFNVIDVTACDYTRVIRLAKS
ncbi:MAG: class I SAM-dependent methyltransferase [Lachnospiraceae bacterium]|jgi:demethylmenaquinone methyltransferase/2-methoxy-6-polyprenyl-1,4-benzoquinol methylase|nr:class I SAM-dependent methyltransferase [Lachnospiraceae bacterium]